MISPYLAQTQNWCFAKTLMNYPAYAASRGRDTGIAEVGRPCLRATWRRLRKCDSAVAA